MKKFSEALVKTMATNVELRSLIKNEALKQFNNDTEVLVANLADLRINGETVASKLNANLQGTTMRDILFLVPTLTLLVPELPMESFSAQNWDVNNQLPMVAIRTVFSNDNPVVSFNQQNQLETGVIPSDIIPGSPILVTKVNERVISSIDADYSNIDSEPFYTSQLNGITYKFTDVVFNGIQFPTQIKQFPTNIDSKLAEAYELTKNISAWQRDHIYYDINSSKPNGPYNYKYKEYLGFVAPNESNGSASAAYETMTDQADPQYNELKHRGNWNDWTEGNYELEFYFTVNNAEKDGGNIIHKKLSIKPNQFFELTYDHYTTGTFVWTRNYFKIRDIKAKKYYADLEIISWDLERFATDLQVKVIEFDWDTETTITDKNSSKAATNFGLDFTDIPLGEKAKLGMKFGTTLEKSTEHTYTIKTTQSSNQLGGSLINFNEPVVTGKNQIGSKFKIDVYTLNSYSTGTIDYSLAPKRVQN